MKLFSDNVLTLLKEKLGFGSKSPEQPQDSVPTHVLPESDLQDWPKAPAMQLMITCDYGRVLNLSYKNQFASLITAMKQVKEHYPHVVFRIAHSRNENEALEDTAAANKRMKSPDDDPFFAAPVVGEKLAPLANMSTIAKSAPSYWDALNHTDFMHDISKMLPEKQKRHIIHMDNADSVTGYSVLNAVAAVDNCVPLSTTNYQQAAQDLVRYVKHIAATGTSPEF